MTTILITGFGPFPGAPFNPTDSAGAPLGANAAAGFGGHDHRRACVPDQLCARSTANCPLC